MWPLFDILRSSKVKGHKRNWKIIIYDFHIFTPEMLNDAVHLGSTLILLINIEKLELCAFALKGEHNVYSLVPNIAVCMYIYIDTKFSYDNVHRQLKHVVLCG